MRELTSLPHHLPSDFLKYMPMLVEGLWSSTKAYLIAYIQSLTPVDIVVITHGQNQLFQDIEFFSPLPPIEFPSSDLFMTEEDPDIIGQRYTLLHQLAAPHPPRIILMQLSSFLEKLPSPQWIHQQMLTLTRGDELPFDMLPELLTTYGYKKRSVVMEKNEFAIRGGILDIFSISAKEPCRIECRDQKVSSLRYFDPISQISVRSTDSLQITLSDDRTTEHGSSILSYCNSPLLIFDDVVAIEDTFVNIKKTIQNKPRSFFSFTELFEATKNKIFFYQGSLEHLSAQHKTKHNPSFISLSFEVCSHTIEGFQFIHPFAPLSSLCSIDENDLWNALRRFSGTLHFIATTDQEKSLIQEQIDHPMIEEGYLSSGFLIPSTHYALIPYTEFTHRYKVRRVQQRVYYHLDHTEISRLEVGDYVVHMKYGIGLYTGMERKTNTMGISTEYMVLEYEGTSKLFVPLDQAHLVTRYIGIHDAPPTLDTLGSSRWERVKAKTEKELNEYAHHLLKMHAYRNAASGIACPPDSELFKQFEGEFPYEETPDQQIAIDQIKQDMMSSKIMDRLLCGDVGYGKTEVAMRAACKAVLDGHQQVAILVPTTLLALQHYDTFVERMHNFPISIALFSRMSKPKEVQEVIKKVEEGKIDILIGTHKLVSSSLHFHNLGLVIIDEEQRFGVRVKEHLKTLKQTIDCLTMSATPIPRTLYLSLIGAKEISMIQTPPQDRLPIQSMVCTKTDEIIQEALVRELAREGQVFVIHNRIETLEEITHLIRRLVPHARILMAHGQMSSSDLDHIFHLFKEGKGDILVATAIIENGVDIPNANTILINDADHFGLADLYQMRGRVGRWHRKAYCYFMVSSIHTLSEIARKRLTALTASTGHGASMKLAMYDLELRGAGDILGTEQSGFVAQVGFHLYCKMLKKTIDRIRHHGTPVACDEAKIELPIDARFPEEYINDMQLRLECYHRLGELGSSSDIDLFKEELSDRFGPPPLPVLWLLAIAKLKLHALACHITLIKQTQRLLILETKKGTQKAVFKTVYALPSHPDELLPSITKLIPTLSFKVKK